MSHVLGPLAFVDPPVFVHNYSAALSLPGHRVELSAVDAVSVLLDAERVRLPHRFVIEFVTDHVVLLDRVAVVLKCVLTGPRSEPLHLHFFLDLLVTLD